MTKKTENFTPEEERDYKELVERTNVYNFPNSAKSSDRPTSTSKYNFLGKLLGLTTGDEGPSPKRKRVEYEEDDEEDDEEEEDENENGGENENEVEKDGTGISFLPGDISGLIKQFHLLLTEFHAGNKSATKTQLVAILDELLRRSYLNQDEYNGVCRALLC